MKLMQTFFIKLVFVVTIDSGNYVGIAQEASETPSSSVTPDVNEEQAEADDASAPGKKFSLGLNESTLLDYKSCLKAVVKESRSISKDAAKAKIEECKAYFPETSLLFECKRNGFKAAKADDRLTQIKTYIQECNQLLTVTKLDNKDSVPFGFWRDRIYFARMPIHDQVLTDTFEHPSYGCDLNRIPSNTRPDSDFVLWGMSPLKLTAFSKLGSNKAFALLRGRMKKIKDGDYEVRGLGKIYTDKNKDNMTLYFPTVPCAFKPKLNDGYYESHKVFYLDGDGSDETKRYFKPYFGMSTFKNGAASLSLSQLTSDVLKRMDDPRVRPYTLENGDIWIAHAEPTAFDSTGEPKDICALPQPFPKLLIWVRVNSKARTTAYQVIAMNPSSFCSFAEERVKAFIKNY